MPDKLAKAISNQSFFPTATLDMCLATCELRNTEIFRFRKKRVNRGYKHARSLKLQGLHVETSPQPVSVTKAIGFWTRCVVMQLRAFWSRVSLRRVGFLTRLQDPASAMSPVGHSYIGYLILWRSCDEAKARYWSYTMWKIPCPFLLIHLYLLDLSNVNMRSPCQNRW
jgi:hypothetical protein